MFTTAKAIVYAISMASLVAVSVILYDLNLADGSPASIRQAAAHLGSPISSATFAILFVGGGALAAWSRSSTAAISLLPALVLSFTPIMVGSRGDLSVPRGAIVAFQRQFDLGGTLSQCPNGWTSVPELAGRFPIGAGIGSFADGTTLTPRVLGEYGGKENHTLTEAEMPRHTHTFSGDAVTRGGNGGVGRTLAVGDRADFQNYKPTGNNEHTGDGEAHDIMPPFRVVQFCRLD